MLKNKYSKRGKTTLLPRFPYGHTDEGECGAILIKVCPFCQKPWRVVQIVHLQGKRKGVYTDVHDRRAHEKLLK